MGNRELYTYLFIALIILLVTLLPNRHSTHVTLLPKAKVNPQHKGPEKIKTPKRSREREREREREKKKRTQTIHLSYLNLTQTRQTLPFYLL